MTTSRLKFELIDSVESIGLENCRSPDVAAPTLNGSRHSGDVMKDQLAQFSESVSRQSDALRPTLISSVLDSSLLRDLAEGLEFLHHQMDVSESELERSREQSHSIEQDARRWGQESARLQQETEDTRAALVQLRLEFEESRESSHEQTAAVERIVEEMADLRAARSQLENLAAEQQRALVLSLELLKRVDVAERLEGPDQTAPELSETTSEIADLKCRLAAADQRCIQVDGELAEVRAQFHLGQMESTALRSDLDMAHAELAKRVAELCSVKADLTDFKAKFESGEAELRLAREELNQLVDIKPRTEPEAQRDAQGENARISKILVDAEAEIALQNAEVDSRGAIILALENALEEQNTSLRALEERFLTYAEQVQSLQLERLPKTARNRGGIAWRFSKLFSPPRKKGSQKGTQH